MRPTSTMILSSTRRSDWPENAAPTWRFCPRSMRSYDYWVPHNLESRLDTAEYEAVVARADLARRGWFYLGCRVR